MTDAISTRVVMAVAETKGVDPANLPSLHNAVDADALDALVSSSGEGDGKKRDEFEVRFTYAERGISIRDEEIVVTETSQQVEETT